MKTYKGKTENEKKIIKVSEGEREYSLEYNDPFLVKRCNSEDFDWGCGSAKAANTALVILIDCLGYVKAAQLYQAFKWKFVARWNEEWSITQDEIERWAKPKMKSLSFFVKKPKRLKITRK
jgi:hypothetical protein